MRLGVDFGTTRTVVATGDRGNFPLVSFKDEGGTWSEWYPSRIAAYEGKIVYGHRAHALRGVPGSWHLPSVKRLLARSSPDRVLLIPGAGEVTVLSLLAGFFESLRGALRKGTSSVAVGSKDRLEAMISVPANSNSNQRFLTMEAFKAAGFEVVGMMNEPSAAGVEYAHAFVKRPDAPRSREYVAVYDLGGGTFDAAAIRISGMRHEVVSNEGVEQLGGDDFDDMLLDLVVEEIGSDRALDPRVRTLLLDECRERKEGLNPNTRKILVDTSVANVGIEEVVVSTAAYYERCEPLVDETIACLERVLERLPHHEEADGGLPSSVATVYLVGGSVSFPLVARVLRERYGRRVQRSPYPHGAVAIGLAVAANPDEPYFVRETLTRHFGVWREADAGSRVVFDPIFVKDAALEHDGALRAERRYHPAHNIGRFRFAECSSLTTDGDPAESVTPWDAFSFAFDPHLRDRSDLEALPVERVDPGRTETIVEEYSCDANGIVRVTLRSLESGFERSFSLAGSL